MADQPSSKAKTVWAHVADQSDLDAVTEVIGRLFLEGTPCNLVVTGPSDLENTKQEVVSLRDFDLEETRPEILLWLDNKLSSRMLGDCHRLKIPVVLANISTEVLQETPWIWQKGLARSALKPVRFSLVQSDEDKEFLVGLGLTPSSVLVTGTLQGCGLPPGYDAAERQDIYKTLTGCPVLFARALPKSETNLMLTALVEARKTTRKLTLILDPEHEEDAAEIAQVARDLNLIVHERAVEGVPGLTTQVFVTDGAFERGLWYSLAAATYLGGTFNGTSCRNPLVSAAVGTALIHGPNIPRHHAAFARMTKAGAVSKFEKAEDFAATIVKTLRPETAAEYAHAGWMMVANAAEGLDRAVDLVKDVLETEEAL